MSGSSSPQQRSSRRMRRGKAKGGHQRPSEESGGGLGAMHLLVIVLVASCSLTLYTLLHDLSITPSSPSLVPQRHPTPHRSLAITDLSRIVEQQALVRAQIQEIQELVQKLNSSTALRSPHEPSGDTLPSTFKGDPAAVAPRNTAATSQSQHQSQEQLTAPQSQQLSQQQLTQPQSQQLSQEQLIASQRQTQDLPTSVSGPRQAGPGGSVWKPLDEVTQDDWLVYIRMQKTGSQTFWQTLQEEFNGGKVWGTRGKCQRGLFCGYHCEGVVRQQIRDVQQSNRLQCQLIVRGHINWHDYEHGFNAMGIPLSLVHFLVFLREPVSRAVSEYRHITEGLVAQFGPHTFGAAWDYNFSFDPKMALEEKRARGTVDHWLQCEQCKVGSSNRMTRFLSGLAPTGDMETAQTSEAVVLSAAMANLRRCAFIGLLERYEDSMLVLRHTFPRGLTRLRTFSDRPHPKAKVTRTITPQQMDQIRADNALDIELHSAASQLFEHRWQSMLSQLTGENSNLRFRKQAHSRLRTGESLSAELNETRPSSLSVGPARPC